MRYLLEVLFSIQFRVVCLTGIVVALILPPDGIGFSLCTLERFWGLPCPGCGLTRGVSSFYHLRWGASLQYNLFAPLAALLMGFFGGLIFVPRRPLGRVRDWCFRREGGLLWLFVSLVALFLAYGLARLALVWLKWGEGGWLVGKF